MRLPASRASKIFEDFQKTKSLPGGIDQELRSKLFEPLKAVLDRVEKDGGKKMLYEMDWKVGIKLYDELLPARSIGMAVAADTDFWRYVSLLAIPDIVQRRYPGKPERFWQHKRRIWLKAVWWYVHLSRQADDAVTERILERLSTDHIVQLVERSGPNGYRVSLYRAIMAESLDHPEDMIRRVMKFNTARLVSTEPEVFDGGIEKYVQSLYG